MGGAPTYDYQKLRRLVDGLPEPVLSVPPFPCEPGDPLASLYAMAHAVFEEAVNRVGVIR